MPRARKTASLECRGGRFYVRYPVPGGKRKRFAIGTDVKSEAEKVLGHVIDLMTAKQTGQVLPTPLIAWVEHVRDCDPALAKQLEQQGLIEQLEPTAVRTVGTLCREFFNLNAPGCKASTIQVWRHTERNLLGHFGCDRELSTITVGHAREFQAYLQTLDVPTQSGRLSVNTVRRRCGIARQFFDQAVDYGWISDNPFRSRKIKTAVGGNEALMHYVTEEEAIAVLNACPDVEWKTMWALARWGGLRCRSETSQVKIADVDFANQSITFRSPKTEHHEGKETRTIPLFAELEHLVRDCIEQAADGDVFLLERTRHHPNPRVQFARFALRAGVEVWPKLMQNCRSTRETELYQRTKDIHFVCRIIGNSPQVAMKHYLQLTDEAKRNALAKSDRTPEQFTELVRAASDGASNGAKTAPLTPGDERVPHRDPS